MPPAEHGRRHGKPKLHDLPGGWIAPGQTPGVLIQFCNSLRRAIGIQTGFAKEPPVVEQGDGVGRTGQGVEATLVPADLQPYRLECTYIDFIFVAQLVQRQQGLTVGELGNDMVEQSRNIRRIAARCGDEQALIDVGHGLVIDPDVLRGALRFVEPVNDPLHGLAFDAGPFLPITHHGPVGRNIELPARTKRQEQQRRKAEDSGQSDRAKVHPCPPVQKHFHRLETGATPHPPQSGSAGVPGPLLSRQSVKSGRSRASTR